MDKYMEKLKILSMMSTKNLCAIKSKHPLWFCGHLNSSGSKYKMSHETWVDVAVYIQNNLNQNLANKRTIHFFMPRFFPKKTYPTNDVHLKRKKIEDQI